MLIEILITFLLLAGAAFTLLGSLGLVRFPDFFTRLHGPSKATTLGLGSILLATMLFPLTQGASLALRPLLITIFLFLTAPVSAHLLSKAAIALRIRSAAPLPPTDIVNEEKQDG